MAGPRLVAALSRALAPAGGARVLETHISWVILTGSHAYKIKKPVDLGFVDFRSLAKRKHFCEEELRLNRRLAPDLYLDVIAITGSEEAPVAGGAGTAIEYAVRMREFPQDALASRALARGEIGPAFVDGLAQQVAAFHDRAAAAEPRDAAAHTDAILALALRNCERLGPVADTAQVQGLAAWTRAEHARLVPTMAARLAEGRVRECHGDLHLANIAVISGRATIFDCIEFDPGLRWIDVMSEAAFLVMDFGLRGRVDLGYRFLNAYLEIAGDYAGLAVLPFYVVYRALVRAMVACERAAQLDPGPAREEALREARAHVSLAWREAYRRDAALLVTHGFSGSGKTTGSQALIETLPAVRIRTDVERKRLHGLRPQDREPAGLASSMYSPDATRRTYRHVLAHARTAAAAGFAAVADGTFLRQWQREMFRDAARELGVPFLILSFKARADSMRARIAARLTAAGDASDADLDVLDQQLVAYDPLTADELECAIAVDTEQPESSAGQWHKSVGAALASRRAAACAT
ncbi:MAG: AAA family ATPase [Burkholderiales bacterium]|nr:AAA family ATPase [Burkholderiales bacterium]